MYDHKKVERTQQRIALANEVLATFAGKTTFIVKRRRDWVLKWRWYGYKYTRLLRISRDDGRLLAFRKDEWKFSPTQEMALVQLYRWIRDFPVLPLSTWRLWASPAYHLLPPDAVDRLQAGGYPEEVFCVRCGKIIEAGSLVWWAQHRRPNADRSGPCHYGGC